MTDEFNCASCAQGVLYPDGRLRCGIEKCRFERGIYKIYSKPEFKQAKKLTVKETKCLDINA